MVSQYQNPNKSCDKIELETRCSPAANFILSYSLPRDLLRDTQFSSPALAGRKLVEMAGTSPASGKIIDKNVYLHFSVIFLIKK